MSNEIKSPGLILGSDGHPARLQGSTFGGKHESSTSLLNMLKDQNRKATQFASVMAATVDGIKRSFRSFVQVTHPLLDHDGVPALDPKLEQAVNEFIAVLEEQLSVQALDEKMKGKSK